MGVVVYFSRSIFLTNLFSLYIIQTYKLVNLIKKGGQANG